MNIGVTFNLKYTWTICTNYKKRLSIIYGRNGSGKTSIAKAIRQLVGKDSKPQEGYIIAKRLADWEFTDLTFRRNLIIKGHSHRL